MQPPPPNSPLDPNVWNKCNSCKKSIGWAARYYKCSVSTCNSARYQLVFCSVDCWDAHVPGQRHRSAYCTEQKSPPKPG